MRLLPATWVATLPKSYSCWFFWSFLFFLGGGLDTYTILILASCFNMIHTYIYIMMDSAYIWRDIVIPHFACYIALRVWLSSPFEQVNPKAAWTYHLGWEDVIWLSHGLSSHFGTYEIFETWTIIRYHKTGRAYIIVVEIYQKIIFNGFPSFWDAPSNSLTSIIT